jgi:hypothetical protein
MKLKVNKFQEGGQVPVEQAPAAPEGAPAGGNPEDMLMQIAQTAMQALQNQDCEAAMAVCQAFIQMIQEQQGGATPEEPVYKAGGKLVRRIKK